MQCGGGKDEKARQLLLKLSWKTFVSRPSRRESLSLAPRAVTKEAQCLTFANQFPSSLQIKTETMTETSISRGATPPNLMNQDYDITRMREDDFERLAVYIVPDVPCERGTPARAEKTLPRSLTLKASLVLSVPNQPVSENAARRKPSEIKNVAIGFPGRRCMEYGRDSEGHPLRSLRRTPNTELPQR